MEKYVQYISVRFTNEFLGRKTYRAYFPIVPTYRALFY